MGFGYKSLGFRTEIQSWKSDDFKPGSWLSITYFHHEMVWEWIKNRSVRTEALGFLASKSQEEEKDPAKEAKKSSASEIKRKNQNSVVRQKPDEQNASWIEWSIMSKTAERWKTRKTALTIGYSDTEVSGDLISLGFSVEIHMSILKCVQKCKWPLEYPK